MTVSYQYEVASSTSGGFTRLLFMWKGSLYKLIYRELLLFVASFGLLSALYRLAFTEPQKRLFEKAVMYCDTFINLIPLSFVLGFYVSYVASRWWQQYMAIPWPDKIMHSIALYVNGNDDHGRMVRRTLVRYLNLSLILVLRSISSAVKRRFPTLDHLVESGFMTTVELEIYQSVPSVEFNTYWIPCTWFISLLKETRRESRITDPQGMKLIMEVVTIATYSFFLAALVGRQYVDDSKKPMQMEIDIYIPVFTILQFFFFMGLLKVAEQLINPFGDDDEDFELNWIIDRHTKVSYLGVDILMRRCPPLTKDLYFDEVNLTLPYTEAAVAYKKKTYRGSVHNMLVPEEKHTMFLPEILEEDEEETPVPKMPGTKTPSAAGIWRSRPPSSRSLLKYGDSASVGQTGDETVREDVIIDPERRTSLVNRSHWSIGSAQGSIKLKHVDSNASNTMHWPSSSTLARSDTSLKISQQSLEDRSSYTNINSFVDFNRHKIGLIPSVVLRSTHGLDKFPVSQIKPKIEHAFNIRALPKLAPIKKHCITEGKKRGVRWKPLVANLPSAVPIMDSGDHNTEAIYECLDDLPEDREFALRHKESIASGKTSISTKSERCNSSDSSEKGAGQSVLESKYVQFKKREGTCSFPLLHGTKESFAERTCLSQGERKRHFPVSVRPLGVESVRQKLAVPKMCQSLPSVLNPHNEGVAFTNFRQMIDHGTEINTERRQSIPISSTSIERTPTIPQNEVTISSSVTQVNTSRRAEASNINNDDASWHSADWTTLLDGDVFPEVIPNLNTDFYIHARPSFNNENSHS
ncbi:uncharacterized protein LOC134529312 isoform X2 [Bacillus rossius redtenbacheri]|uniref:uncharacterized protein LOC134529312 isoform X2 n=1 Tax=Bacillus rossius redtenbacheri TaxID=93214 RepID=UPI002FDD995A